MLIKYITTKTRKWMELRKGFELKSRKWSAIFSLLKIFCHMHKPELAFKCFPLLLQIQNYAMKCKIVSRSLWQESGSKAKYAKLTSVEDAIPTVKKSVQAKNHIYWQLSQECIMHLVYYTRLFLLAPATIQLLCQENAYRNLLEYAFYLH